MRATLFLLFFFLIVALLLWATLSGGTLVFAGLLWFMGLVLSFGYTDTAILFFLGAREVKSGDKSFFFEAAAQEAYKLAVSQPRLYLYNGCLERGFVLQNKGVISLVLSRSLLEQVRPQELSAICFELLLQVKKGMASKRTKTMFILGFFSWTSNALSKLISSLVPVKEVNRALAWIFIFFLYPWLDILFKLILGKGYFKRLEAHLSCYPEESEALYRLGLILRKPNEIYSLSSKKLMVFSSTSRSHHFQNILALELLPHEWDIFFNTQELTRA